MVDVSIVMPIFNEAKYLNRSINSVIKQNIINKELICVNDGSTDDSREILEKYAEKYEENYKEVQVLAAGTGITLSEQVEKFSVTQSDKFKTEITDEGCLKNTLNNAANLNADLYEICSTIIVKSADEMKAISNLSQTENEGKDFAGKTIILEEAFELDNTYKLIKTFSGVFEGNSKTITLTKPNEYDKNNYFGGAIFNVITGKDAKVRNLTVEGAAYIAGIAMELENDAVISNCTNNATITSPIGDAVHGCGGIVGELSNGGFIENCINTGTITYNSTNDKGCGGIVGVISSYSPPDKGNSIIANCINKGEIKRVQKEGNVEDDVSIGGICGKVTGNAAIYNCANKGDVTSEINDTSITENIGGITGYCSVSFYEGEFPSLPANSIPDDMGIFNCYNSGTISSSYSSDLKYIGGIVGKGYVGFANSLYYTIRVTNTVNNDGTTFAFGNINISNNSVEFDITNNFYKFSGTSPKYSSYESTFHGVNNSVVSTLNDYSDETGRPYLQWRVDLSGSGNIIFLE
jgi:glycosyltransferase involved in cell wall biosynthesis